MATRTDDWPEGTAPGRGSPRYPWDQWLDGGVWKITRGEDFDIPADRFRLYVQKEGRRRGGRAVTRVIDDTIYFKFTKREDQP